MLLLSDEVNVQLTAMIMVVTAKLMAWHTTQVKELRSCEGSLKWMKRGKDLGEEEAEKR